VIPCTARPAPIERRRNSHKAPLPMTRETVTLEDLRARVSELDRQLIWLVAERQAVSEEVARVKRATGRPTRDYERERDVIMGVRSLAAERGVSPQLAEQLLRLLIRSSLTTQEQASVVAHGAGSGRRALIIGGAGKMGGWFVSFLASQGFTVEVADPAPAPAGVARVEDWRGTDLQHDYIVLATPLGITDAILRDLALRRPPGVIFDVGSLKSPLRAGLLALKSHGCKVTSVHPMFGPDTELLSGRHVVFVDLGSEPALTAARELFASTMAEQVVMSLDDHDRLIAYVLGLSHALNIAFFTALAESGEAAPRLARMSSTTFDAQLDVASGVAQESPELYYEIQSLNDYGAESLEALSQAVERLRASVLTQDHDAFVALMRRGRDYLQDRRTVTERRA
ncbi:MAG: prephenate dehydrogenase/arogenate dehydrogenase family protein, partial [Steroidobacteraceae bacterium]